MAKRKTPASVASKEPALEPIIADPPRPHGLALVLCAILWSIWLLFLIALALNR